MKPVWAEYYDGPDTLSFPREVRVEGSQNSGETLTVVLYIFLYFFFEGLFSPPVESRTTLGKNSSSLGRGFCLI
jgi:hypothetical protein